MLKLKLILAAFCITAFAAAFVVPQEASAKGIKFSWSKRDGWKFG